MMAKILCDTDILIDYLRGKEKAKGFIEQKNIIYISSISVAELYVGVRKGIETEELALFLDTFEIVNINKNIAKTAGLYCNKYKPSHGTGLADALIAATAEEIKAQVATYNVKHFPMFNDIIIPS